MKSIDIEALHAKQYEILLEFDRVCKKYGLTYFLAYGTLLGAIRHKGFIPWDDDIDTLMPYQDYVKLNEIPKSEWKHPFFLQNSETDKNYSLCFSKIRNSHTTLITKELAHLDINQGVDIDIYPLLNLADDASDRNKQYFHTKAYMLLQVNEPPVNHGRVYYFAGKALLTLIPRGLKSILKDRYLSKITQYNNTQNCYVLNGNLEVMKQVLSSKWFTRMVDEQFENKEFPIPNGAVEWLRTRFGEKYMELPPEEKRGFKLSTFVRIDLDHPYTIYRGIDYYNNSKRRKVENNRWVGKDG